MSNLHKVNQRNTPSSATKLQAWYQLMDTHVGALPVPVWLGLIVVVTALIAINGIIQKLAIVIALSATFAFTLVHLGNHHPLLKNIGGGAILVTFLPSLFAWLGWVT